MASRISSLAGALVLLALFGAAHAGTKGFSIYNKANTNLYTADVNLVTSLPYIKDSVSTANHAETAVAYGKNTYTSAYGDAQTYVAPGTSVASSTGTSIAVSSPAKYYGRKLQGTTKGFSIYNNAGTNLYTADKTVVVSLPYIKDAVSNANHAETAVAYGKNTYTSAYGDAQSYVDPYKSVAASTGTSIAVSSPAKYYGKGH